VIDLFIKTIGNPDAYSAFKSAFDDSTNKQIELGKLEQIKDIPCLIIWGEYDKLIPPDHANELKKVLTNAELEIIKDAGHAPFVEKPALVYERIRTFLMK
jgi:pimeloyl-ACP methyl ester carboxylesterase